MDEPPDQNTSRTPLGQDETEESFADRMFMSAQTVDKYYTPILFIFGTLGNSLSLAVFCMNAKYRSQSASYYLSALAISDTGFLVNLLAVWLESVHGGIITSGLMCPLVMYLGQVTCFLSVYLTVAFSIERYVAVHYPLSRPRICTRSKARKVIAALTGVALLFFSYAWVIAQVIEFPSGNDYEELYGENLTQRSIPNLTGDTSSEFDSFPVGRRDKREAAIFNTKLLASKELHSMYDVGSPNFLKQPPNCGNGSHLNAYNKSIHSQDHNQSLNCTRLHLDGNILKGFRKSYHFAEYSGEESSSVSEETFSSEYEKNVTSEDFLLSGGYICSVPQDYFRISEIANYLDTVVTLIIPFFLITFINVRIAICVWKLQRQRLNIVATSSGTSDINHHHHSLRCSNKGYIHHHKRKLSSTKRRSSNKNSSRQHLSEQSCTNSLRENEMGESNSLDFDCERANNVGSKSKKGTVRFQETRYRSEGTTGTQGNGDRSSSSGNEGEICDDNNASPGNDGGLSPGLNLTPKGMATTETLQQTKFLGKFTQMRCNKNNRSHGSFARAKLEQKHKAVPPRVTAKSDFSLTRERRPNTHPHPPPSNAAEVRVTKTLLLVSTVFLVLNLPAHAIRCAQFIQTLRGTSEGHELLHAAQPWTNLLFNTNFAVNFLLYCLSGRNFRKTLRNIILRKFSKKIPNSAWRSMSQTTKQEAALNSNKNTRAKGELPSRRNIRTAELEVAEIVELEERGEVSIYPNNNTNTGNNSREVVLEVDQSLPV